jgi:Flp pilus assembly protein TadG
MSSRQDIMPPNQLPRPAARPRARRGVTVLEAALLLPIILSLVFGTIEFAYVFYVKQTLQSASREGARRGALASADNADIKAAVDAAMESGGLGDSSYKVKIVNATTGTPANASAIPAGTGIRVEISAPWSQFSVFLSGFGDWTRGELRSSTVMRRES